jgi:hypothetical protein
LPKEEIPAGTDLMKVTLIYHFSDFANISTWEIRNQLVAQLYDVNRNGSLSRVSNAGPQGTTSELVVSRPGDKFSGIPKVRIVQMGNDSVPFDIVVRYYKRTAWSWVTKIDISGSTLTASLEIPNNASPGVYAGLVAVSDGDSRSVIPVSVVVPIVAAGKYQGTPEGTPYENFAVYGAFDWGWRYEAGDWRTFTLLVPAGVRKVGVSVAWSDPDTDIQLHLTDPLGYVVSSSEYPKTKNLGKGKFQWSTSTNGARDDISADASAGVYFLVLHNTLFGARSFASYPEPFTLDVRFT